MKLIKLNPEHYIIVDGSEIKIGCIVAEKLVNGSYEMFTIHTLNDINSSCQNVITHSTQPIENFIDSEGIERRGWTNIKVLELSEVKELIGEVDVEKRAKESNDNHIKEFKSYPEIRYLHYGKGFISGYNQALEDNKERRFSEEDIRKAIAMGYDWCHQKHIPHYWMVDNFIQSLQPKTEWEIEFIDGKLKLKS